MEEEVKNLVKEYIILIHSVDSHINKKETDVFGRLNLIKMGIKKYNKDNDLFFNLNDIIACNRLTIDRKIECCKNTILGISYM